MPFSLELAKEWTQDLTNHVKRFTMPNHDPQPLDDIDIIDEDEDELMKYDNGKLFNLGQFLWLDPVIGEKSCEYEDCEDTFIVNVTLVVRLLRTSFDWQYYFSDGTLRMYHTCGQKLPRAIFDVSIFCAPLNFALP